jgi:hypothetical protein
MNHADRPYRPLALALVSTRLLARLTLLGSPSLWLAFRERLWHHIRALAAERLPIVWL